MIRVPVSAAGYQYRRVSAQFRCSSALLAAAAAFIDPTSGREPRARANHSSPAPAPAAAGDMQHTHQGGYRYYVDICNIWDSCHWF